MVSECFQLPSNWRWWCWRERKRKGKKVNSLPSLHPPPPPFPVVSSGHTDSPVSQPFKSDFPPELMFDILVRLPPKDLIRWMCVSKSYNDLIRDHRFIKSHRRRARETNSSANATIILTSLYRNTPLEYYRLCFNENDATGRVVKIEPPLRRSHHILGHCNALVCIQNDNDRDLVLWNPTIQRVKKVSFPTFELEPLEKIGRAHYGFGYDSTNDDYKIVGIMELSNSDYSVMSYVVKVYSLKSNSWKTIQSMPCIGVKFHLTRILFVNGAFSWLMYNNLDERPYVILTLDLASESYREFPIPLEVRGDFSIHLGFFGDYLCIYSHLLNRCLWIMKEYGVTETWTQVLYDSDPLPWCFHISSLSRSGEIVLLKKDYDEMSLSYLDKRRAQDIKICGRSDPSSVTFCVTSCVGSLCLLDGDPVVVRRQQKVHKMIRIREENR